MYLNPRVRNRSETNQARNIFLIYTLEDMPKSNKHCKESIKWQYFFADFSLYSKQAGGRVAILSRITQEMAEKYPCYTSEQIFDTLSALMNAPEKSKI